MGEIKEVVHPIQVDYICDACKIGRMRKTGEIIMEEGLARHRCDNPECGDEHDYPVVYPLIRYEAETTVMAEGPIPPPDESLMDDGEETPSETEQSTEPGPELTPDPEQPELAPEPDQGFEPAPALAPELEQEAAPGPGPFREVTENDGEEPQQQ